MDADFELPCRRMDEAGGCDTALIIVVTATGAGARGVIVADFGARPSAAWISLRVSLSAKIALSSSRSRTSRSLPRTLRERSESMPMSLNERVPVSSARGMPTSFAMLRRMVARMVDSSPLSTSSVSMME